MDWGAWSREAVAIGSEKTLALLTRHNIADDATYQWNLEDARLTLGGVEFPLVTVGTVDGDSFLWSWANLSLPAACRAGIEKVRAFGEENDLGLLFESSAPGGLAQGKECLALSLRILDGAGIFIDETDFGFILFVLFEPAATADSAR